MLTNQMVGQHFTKSIWDDKRPGYPISLIGDDILVPTYLIESEINSYLEIIDLDNFQATAEFDTNGILIHPIFLNDKVHSLLQFRDQNGISSLDYLVFSQQLEPIYSVEIEVSNLEDFSVHSVWSENDTIVFAGDLEVSGSNHSVLMRVSALEGLISVDTVELFGSFRAAGFFRTEESCYVWGLPTDTVINGVRLIVANIDRFGGVTDTIYITDFKDLEPVQGGGVRSEFIIAPRSELSLRNNSSIWLHGTTLNWFSPSPYEHTNAFVAWLNPENDTIEKVLIFDQYEINSAAIQSELFPCGIDSNLVFITTEETSTLHGFFEPFDSSIGLTILDNRLNEQNSLVHFANDGVYQRVHSHVIVENRVVLLGSEYTSETGINCFLAIFDCNGRLLSIQFTPSKDQVPRLYPNPSNGVVTIQAESIIRRVEVWSLNGSKVLEMNGDGQSKTIVDLSNMGSGSYLFNIYTNDGFDSRIILKN